MPYPTILLSADASPALAASLGEEWITRGTALIAVTLYVASSAWRWPPARRRNASRLLYSLGAAVFLAHVAVAFQFFHDWSHAAAYEHVASVTESFVGLRWGGGIWWNYAFTAAWTFDTLWWCFSERSYLARPRWLHRAWHSVFLFMAVQGVVVFGGVAGRSLAALFALFFGFRILRRRNSPTGDPAH